MPSWICLGWGSTRNWFIKNAFKHRYRRDDKINTTLSAHTHPCTYTHSHTPGVVNKNDIKVKIKGQWNSALDRDSAGIVEFIICCINQRFNYVAARVASLSLWPSACLSVSLSAVELKVDAVVSLLKKYIKMLITCRARKRWSSCLSCALALIKLSGKQTQRKLF